MTRLIRAEYLKLRTTQVWFWLLLSAIAISVLVAVGSLASSDGVKTADDVPGIFANAMGGVIAIFVLGVLSVTTEFRYQTITPTVLATPSRWAIVSAKLITYAVAGALYAVACVGVQVAIAAPWLSSKHIRFTVDDPDLRRALFGMLLVSALYAIIGIGLGALLRNQIVAVTIGLLFLLVLQHIVAAIPHVRSAWPYMPGGATDAILLPAGKASIDSNIHMISPGAGVLVLLAWALVPAIIGAGLSMNRDIT